jgi:hypothetical protein
VGGLMKEKGLIEVNFQGILVVWQLTNQQIQEIEKK